MGVTARELPALSRRNVALIPEGGPRIQPVSGGHRKARGGDVRLVSSDPEVSRVLPVLPASSVGGCAAGVLDCSSCTLPNLSAQWVAQSARDAHQPSELTVTLRPGDFSELWEWRAQRTRRVWAAGMRVGTSRSQLRSLSFPFAAFLPVFSSPPHSH